MPQQISDKAIVHIVDDDESLRRVVDSLCRSIDLHTRTYGSAQEFIDAKREDIPGCLVLDVRLPGISGLDFQTKLAELGIKVKERDLDPIAGQATGRCRTEAGSTASNDCCD